MAKSQQGGVDDTGEFSRQMATYLPSLGSRAPMFIKSNSPISESMYTMGDASPELVNPPVTPWEDFEDEREFNPIRSPVNMLLATDLSEVGLRSTTEFVPVQASTRWPYLKQNAARHVYGNLRSRLQSREKVPTASPVSLTYAPSTSEQSPQLEGLQVQTIGIGRTKHQLSKKGGNNMSKYRPQSTKGIKTSDQTVDYRISLKSTELESRGCVSAPPPTAESAAKPFESMTKTTHHRQRSKTAREFYRPKKGPHVKFDTSELPPKLQKEPRLPEAPPSPGGGDLRVTWSDVVTAKSNGVFYRNRPNGLPRRTGEKDPRGNQEQLYLSPELWGILDEDIGSIKKVAGKS